MQGFIALNRLLRRAECSQPQARVDTALHKAMVLFQHIIYLPALSALTGLWQGAVVLEGLKGPGVRGVLVDRDDPRGTRMGGPEHLAEEALSRIGIARGAQHAVQCGSRGVDGTVEVVPRLLDLDRGFIHAGGVVRHFQPRSTAVIQLRCLALDPAKHGGMIDKDAAFPPQFFPITIAQGIP